LQLPRTEDACDNSIIIPLYVPMADEDVQQVIAALKKLLTSN
jgi:dTDP-4-amino-4,6-dideoxygalactose transaminase